MSDQEYDNIDYEDSQIEEPELTDASVNEPIVEELKSARGTVYKRPPTAKSLATMRQNLAKGREKRQKIISAQKEQEKDYETMMVNMQAPKQQTRRLNKKPKKYEDDEFDDEYEEYEEEVPEFKIVHEKKVAKPSKLVEYMEKQTQILSCLLNAQTKALKKPKVEKNMIIQIPKNNTTKPVTPAILKKLHKLNAVQFDT